MYIPSNSATIIMELDGRYVDKLLEGSYVYDAQVLWKRAGRGGGFQGDLLLSGRSLVPRELWSSDGFSLANSIAFPPDCKYLAVAGWYNNRLVVLDSNGKVIAEAKFDAPAVPAAWWRDEVAVGLANGEVHVFGLEAPSTIKSETREAPSTTTSSAPGVLAPALLIPLLRRRTR